jgi:hypothetical protein
MKKPPAGGFKSIFWFAAPLNLLPAFAGHGGSNQTYKTAQWYWRTASAGHSFCGTHLTLQFVGILRF